MYPSATHTKDVVMRLHVAVIARNVVEEGYLARLSHVAKLLQNPVDRGQGYVRMPAAHCIADLVGAGVVLRSQEGSYDGEPLGGDCNPPLATPRHELAQSLSRVSLTPPSIQEPEFSHESILAEYKRRNAIQRKRPTGHRRMRRIV
jgi:hypothetical protein